VSLDDLKALGVKILKLEREFNAQAGFTKEDDRLPEFMKQEKIPPHNVIFTVPMKNWIDCLILRRKGILIRVNVKLFATLTRNSRIMIAKRDRGRDEGGGFV